MSLLRCDEVTMRFGGHTALDRVSLEAETGRITGLIGPNGAGKTTLFNVVTGLLTPTEGSVHVGDKEITKLAPFRRARLGMARTFQRLELWGQLTVEENVRVAADIRRSWSRQRDDVSADVERINDRIGLRDRADERSDMLPTGQARLVEIGRALAAKPAVLLLDEPASGLDETETEQLARLLRDLRDEGMTIVLVEHDMSIVMAVCDVIHVLDFGKIIASGSPTEIQQNQAVLEAYLGTSGRENA
jgi:branched-chain amino acid transport system ATP-binding protein